MGGLSFNEPSPQILIGNKTAVPLAEQFVPISCNPIIDPIEKWVWQEAENTQHTPRHAQQLHHLEKSVQPFIQFTLNYYQVGVVIFGLQIVVSIKGFAPFGLSCEKRELLLPITAQNETEKAGTQKTLSIEENDIFVFNHFNNVCG